MNGSHTRLANILLCLFVARVVSLKHICQETKCNLNVCFALTGSLSPSTYKLQKDVVREVVDKISAGKNEVALAAVQYATSTLPISRLTTDKKAFLSGLDSSEQSKGKMSFTVGGLNYCFAQLEDELGESGKESSIVLFGEGGSDIGSNPAERSAEFSENGGVVFAVGVGKSQDTKALTAIAGGEKKRVFALNDDSNATDVSVQLAKSLCDCAGKDEVSEREEKSPAMGLNEVE